MTPVTKNHHHMVSSKVKHLEQDPGAGTVAICTQLGHWLDVSCRGEITYLSVLQYSPHLHNVLRDLGLNVMEIKSLITEVKCLGWGVVCSTDQNGCLRHLCTISAPSFAPSICQWSRFWKTNCWEKTSRSRSKWYSSVSLSFFLVEEYMQEKELSMGPWYYGDW